MRIASVCLLMFVGSTLQAQTGTFFQGTFQPGTFVRDGVRITPYGTATINGQTVIFDNGLARTRVQTGPLGYIRNSDGSVIYSDGSVQRNLIRSTPVGTATGTNIYTQSGNGIVIDGTRETANGNVITSNGTIVYDDGALNRTVTRTGSNGNSVTANGSIVQTGQGWARNANRVYPNSSSSVQSEVVRVDQGFNRATNRIIANGQIVQGTGSVNYANGQFSGFRSAQSTSGRGFSGQSTALRFSGGYTRSGTRSSNFGASRGARRGRRGR